MIIVVRPNATDAQIQHILNRVRELGYQATTTRGAQHTIIGLVGENGKMPTDSLSAIDGVEQVLPIVKPFKLADRNRNSRDTVVQVGAVQIGGGSLALIAGPCAVEELDSLRRIAARVKAAGANILRGGAFKPRTSPYSFQGLGVEGLKILRQVGDEFSLPVVTEIMNVTQVEVVCQYADMLQIGSRNMQNFDLLREVGQASKPVLLKRGMSATVRELLMSAEYVLSAGNSQVILCERGVKSFEDSTRNMLDLSAVPNVKAQSHLPIIVDPSHATGRADLVPAMTRAAIAAGADGVIVEVHDCPERALSDGAQALRPDQFDTLMKDLQRLTAALANGVH
jgi:3-deoxy-7-phosphoheptulonate synthase